MQYSYKKLLIIVFVAGLAGGCADPFLSRNKLRDSYQRIQRERLARNKPVFHVISGRKVTSRNEAIRNLAAHRQKYVSPLDRAKLDVIHFEGVPLFKVALALTEMTGQNIVVSNEAGAIPIRIHLKNVTGRTALDTIRRLNNLFYREEENVIRILTAAEYTKGLTVYRDDQTRLCFLQYASAIGVADMVSSLFEDQVEYNEPSESSSYGHVGTDGEDPFENVRSGDDNSQNRRRYDNRGSRFASSRRGLRRRISRMAGDENRQLATVAESKTGAVSASDILKDTTVAEIRRQRTLARMTVFPRNNCIAIRSMDTMLLREIFKTIEALDTPTRQVLLEVKILDVQLGDGFESFFNINFQSDKSRHTVKALDLTSIVSETLSYVYLGKRIEAQIELLQKSNRLHTIATPLLVCANNAPAEFFVGEEVPIVTGYTEATQPTISDTGEIVTPAIQPTPIVELKELGTTVKIIPSINRDGKIALRFLTNVSSAKLQGATIPVIDKDGNVQNLSVTTVDSNKVETIMVGKNGQAMIIGGLIRESIVDVDESVPILSDIPLLGFFFKKITKSKTKTEKVILIVPHILDTPRETGKYDSQILKNLSSHPYNTENLKKMLEHNNADGRLRTIPPIMDPILPVWNKSGKKSTAKPKKNKE